MDHPEQAEAYSSTVEILCMLRWSRRRIALFALQTDLRRPKATTINREVTMLSLLFDVFVKWKLAQDNPVAEVKLFKEDNGRKGSLTQQVGERLLAALTANFASCSRSDAYRMSKQSLHRIPKSSR